MKQNSRTAESAAKRRYWKDQIEHWKAGGLSQAEFCRQNRLKPTRWFYWKRKLTQPSTPVQFVRLDMDRFMEPEPAASQSSPVRLVLGDGIHIEVPKGFDPGTLEQVIRTLQRIGC